jgi:hypothetical protein
MSAMFSIAAALALSCSGMAGLCLAMDRHHQQMRGIRKVPLLWRRCWRGGGWVLLTSALLFCIKIWGPGIGIVTWCAALTAGAMTVIGLLPYWPRLIPRIAVAAAFIGIVLMAWEISQVA